MEDASGAESSTAGSGTAPSRAQYSQGVRRTFVLVHGAWHGGWCWRRVADILQSRGHLVFTPTLTGLGERSHLINQDIDLATHITDVVNIFQWEELKGVVLCGHSYGGFIISGVVEKVLPQVFSLVYLDAFVPQDGQAFFDLSLRRDAITEATKGGDMSVKPPPAEFFNVNIKDRGWVDGKTTPQPIGTFLEKIKLTGAYEQVPKKTYIRAMHYSQPAFDKVFQKRKANPSWRTFELPSGHDVMIDMPEQLAEILLEVA